MADLNNVDEFIYENATRNDELKGVFLKKYVAELKDNNTSRDYSSNQVIFDNSAISMSGSYVDWAHGVLEVPAICVVSGDNGAAIDFTAGNMGAESDFLIALKNGINIFDSFQVEYNSVQVVNATTYINAYLNMRLNTEMSKADEELHGDTYNFYKDNGSSWLYANGHADGTTSCGRGLCNNRNSTMSIQSCSSNLDETFNTGMMKRQMKMVNTSTIKNGKEILYENANGIKTFNLDYVEHNAAYIAYYYNILIPLNWLYFFKELPLIRNGNMKITFTLNANCGVSVIKKTTGFLTCADGGAFQGSCNTMPVMIGASSVVIKTSAANRFVSPGAGIPINTTYTVNAGTVDVAGSVNYTVGCGSSNIPISAEATLYISFSVVKCNSTIGAPTHASFNLQTKKGQCRLLVPTYQFVPEYQKMYETIKQKHVPFLNVVGGQILNCLPNATFDKVIVQSIARAKRLIIIPYLSAGAYGNGCVAATGLGAFSEWKSVFSSAPATTAPVLPLLTNMQVNIASILPIYQNPQSVQFEHYLNEVQSTGLNFGLVMGGSTSTLSMKDHANCYGYFIVKLDRHKSGEENVPVSIQVSGMNNCKRAIDLYCYIEYMDNSFVVSPSTGEKLVYSGV